MKISVSVPSADVQLLDEFARVAGLPSRSAAVQHAIQLLRLPDLEKTTPPLERSGRPPATATPGRRPAATVSPMLRGDIHLVDLDPVRGNEASRQRPAVIVSNDRADAAAQRLRRGVAAVVPVTSNVTDLLAELHDAIRIHLDL